MCAFQQLERCDGRILEPTDCAGVTLQIHALPVLLGVVHASSITELECDEPRNKAVTPIQKIMLTALNAFVAPLLELTSKRWSFAAERATLERSLDAWRDPRLNVSIPELSAWRERVINQRKALRKLRLHLLERTEVWTGATYAPVEQLDQAALLEAMKTHTAEALELLNTLEPLTPNLLERAVYSKLNVTTRCALCMHFAAFNAVKDAA